MNTNFLSVIKKIIADQGEAILAEPQRLKGWISDYAKDEPKAERLAFGRCIEYGAYAELKNVPVEGRAAVKNRLAQRLHSEEGLDTALCAGALDLLEVAVFGELNAAAQPEMPPEIAAPKSLLSEKTPAQESKPVTIDYDFSYISKLPIKKQMVEEKHPVLNGAHIVIFFVVILIIGGIISSNRNTSSNNPANHSPEQSAPKRDINGLTAADYDDNGWAKKDGRWVASPDGARYSAQPANTERPHVRIVNSTGYTVWYVYVVASTAQSWGNDKLGSGILSSGSSVLIDLPSSSTNRYGIRLKDLDGDTYTKRNIPINNKQIITFTLQDLDQRQ
jgi:hypothetical protein